MAYVALKPCRFAGTAYKIGDKVPEGALVPGAEKRLLGMGILAPAGQAEPQTVSRPTPVRKTVKKTEAGEGK